MKIMTSIIITVFLYGCSNDKVPSDDSFKLDVIPSDSIKGRYSAGYEGSVFTPCNSGENWGIRGGTSQFSSIYGSIANDKSPTVFIQAKGNVSELGEFGHLGLNERTFDITELFEMRKPLNDDCNNISFNFESYSTTTSYAGLTVFLNTYISVSKINAPDTTLGYKVEIKMSSLEDVTPNANIKNIGLSVLRDNEILFSAAPYEISIPPDENTLSFLFKSEPFEDNLSETVFNDVDISFKFIFENKELVIMQKTMPVNF